MNTLGTVKTTVVTKEESYAIAHSFTSNEALTKGTPVKLRTDGKIEKCGAATDKPIGIVVSGCKAANSIVTVQTEFAAIMNASADAALTTGDLVSATGVDGNDVAKFKKSVATNYICGVALNAAADTEGVEVGILRTSYLLS